jgi:hypothetical protein
MRKIYYLGVPCSEDMERLRDFHTPPIFIRTMGDLRRAYISITTEDILSVNGSPKSAEWLKEFEERGIDMTLTFHIAKSKNGDTIITEICDEVAQVILDNGWSVEEHPELI